MAKLRTFSTKFSASLLAREGVVVVLVLLLARAVVANNKNNNRRPMAMTSFFGSIFSTIKEAVLPGSSSSSDEHDIFPQQQQQQQPKEKEEQEEDEDDNIVLVDALCTYLELSHIDCVEQVMDNTCFTCQYWYVPSDHPIRAVLIVLKQKPVDSFDKQTIYKYTESAMIEVVDYITRHIINKDPV